MGNIANTYKMLPTLRNRTPDLILTPAGISDDFTGVDGDPPDIFKWRTNGPSSVSIQNNVLNATLLLADTGDPANSNSLIPNYRLVGDFDIQVDWELIQYSIVLSWVSGFTIYDSSGNYWQIFICNEGSPGTKYVTYWNGGGGSFLNLGHTSGKFRVTRISDVIRLYYWNGSWVERAHSGATSSSNVRADIVFITMNNKPDLEIEYDNFICNSADGIVAV